MDGRPYEKLAVNVGGAVFVTFGIEVALNIYNQQIRTRKLTRVIVSPCFNSVMINPGNVNTAEALVIVAKSYARIGVPE